MSAFVKTVLFSGLGIGCLALGSGAQPPTPAPPPPANVPAVVSGTALLQPTPLAPGAYSGTTFMRSGDRVWSVVVAEDGKAIELARKMVAAKGEDKTKLRDQLRESLNKAFDTRQQRHEKEIEALEAQVKKLKDMVEKRSENRKEIIEERMKQLERDASGLGW